MAPINDIPWNRLHHAYGTCEEFPAVLDRLASTDPAARRGARNWLQELLFHQGTHYEANEFTVPFLLETAANPSLPERGKLFTFLNSFLTGRIVPRSPRQARDWRARYQKKYPDGGDSAFWGELQNRSLAAA